MGTSDIYEFNFTVDIFGEPKASASALACERGTVNKIMYFMTYSLVVPSV